MECGEEGDRGRRKKKYKTAKNYEVSTSPIYLSSLTCCGSGWLVLRCGCCKLHTLKQTLKRRRTRAAKVKGAKQKIKINKE